MAGKREVVVELDDPVEWKGETHTRLTFGPLKAKHMALSDSFKGRVQKHMAMIAGMGNVPIQVIEELTADDYEKVCEVTIPLMGKRTTAAVAAAVREAEAEPAAATSH